MRIAIACPARAGTRYGNRVTARRWAGLLRELGHRVRITGPEDAGAADVLVALHARRSAAAVSRFRAEHPERPIVLALTGTDLYHDIHTAPEARQAMRAADRLVVLQPLGLDELPLGLREKARVIYQSASAISGRRPRGVFQVCVVGHLREVKDPFLTARAARGLPADSRIQVIHAGAAMSPALAARARREQRRNPRYRWIGDAPPAAVRRLIASSHILSLTSRMEGGANVISEAVRSGTPVLASAIPGSIGLLGAEYPGYFAAGDAAGLACLLRRAERDRSFYAELRARCRALGSLFRPARERAAWNRLLGELTLRRPGPP